jgi:hypothetical protein
MTVLVYRRSSPGVPSSAPDVFPNAFASPRGRWLRIKQVDRQSGHKINLAVYPIKGVFRTAVRPDHPEARP